MRKYKNYQLKLCSYKKRAKIELMSNQNENSTMMTYIIHSYGNKLFTNLGHQRRNLKSKELIDESEARRKNSKSNNNNA